MSDFDHDEVVITSGNETGSRDKVRSTQRIILPSFEIFSNPTVRIADVKRRRFPLIDRAVQKARQEIMSQEDDAIFKALDSACNSGNKDI